MYLFYLLEIHNRPYNNQSPVRLKFIICINISGRGRFPRLINPRNYQVGVLETRIPLGDICSIGDPLGLLPRRGRGLLPHLAIFIEVLQKIFIVNCREKKGFKIFIQGYQLAIKDIRQLEKCMLVHVATMRISINIRWKVTKT